MNQCLNNAALYQGMTSVVPKEPQELIWALAPAATVLLSAASPATKLLSLHSV
jgi:hypothetical protein